jgi:hypothetical protein
MSDETTHLGKGELADLVPLTTAANEAEALYLVERLEEAHIRATAFTESMRYPNMHPEIRVPRVLLDAARKVIEKARKEAHQRALDFAFEDDETGDGARTTDPGTFSIMQAIATQPEEERNAALKDWIQRWFEQAERDVDIALYLAAAGLTREQAAELVRQVSEERRDALDRTRQGRWNFGVMLALVSGLTLVMVLVLSVLDSASTEELVRFSALPVILLMMSLFAMYSARRTLPHLEPPDADDSARAPSDDAAAKNDEARTSA